METELGSRLMNTSVAAYGAYCSPVSDVSSIFLSVTCSVKVSGDKKTVTTSR